MSEAPQFEEPLKNPEVSDEANRAMDKLTDNAGFTTAEARKKVPEFARLEPSDAEAAKPKATKDDEIDRRGLSWRGRLTADKEPTVTQIHVRTLEEHDLREQGFTVEERKGAEIARRWVDEHESKPEQS